MSSKAHNDDSWDDRVVDYCENAMTAKDKKAFEKELVTNIDLADQVEAYRKLIWALRNKDNQELIKALKEGGPLTKDSSRIPGRDKT